MKDGHRDGCMCNGCMCSRYSLEINSLTNDIESLRAENEELKAKLEALTDIHAQTVAEGVAGFEAMEAKLESMMKDGEVAAYETYKGYLLHAHDPKVHAHSEPTPLFYPPLNVAAIEQRTAEAAFKAGAVWAFNATGLNEGLTVTDDETKLEIHSGKWREYGGPEFSEMREMLRSMQAGELTVSRGLEILDMWWAGNWNNDMLPPVRHDLIEEDSMPVEIIDRLTRQRDLAAEALEIAEQFVDRYSEPWYTSGQNELKKIREAISAIKGSEK